MGGRGQTNQQQRQQRTVHGNDQKTLHDPGRLNSRLGFFNPLFN
jgi:hypothetical protein